MRPHIFFGDQTTHLDPVADFVAGVHIPYGVANELGEPLGRVDLAQPEATVAVDAALDDPASLTVSDGGAKSV